MPLEPFEHAADVVSVVGLSVTEVVGNCYWHRRLLGAWTRAGLDECAFFGKNDLGGDLLRRPSPLPLSRESAGEGRIFLMLFAIHMPLLTELWDSSRRSLGDVVCHTYAAPDG